MTERNVDELISGPPVKKADLQVDIEQSPDLGKFFEALACAQGEMENALKDSKNPHFNSSFADLESVVEAIKGPLAKNKIARHQAPLTKNGEVGVRTLLGHASGQYMAATVWCKAERPGPQALGSVITYLRRYSLAAAAGVAPADDDGEAAEGRGNNNRGNAGPKAQGGGADPKGSAPPPSLRSVAGVALAASAAPSTAPSAREPGSDDEDPVVETGEVPSDLVACWRKVEEGHRKANTYRYEFLPIDPQPRRNQKQNNALHVLRAKRGLSDEDWRKAMMETFNKESSADLSHEEADRLIGMLEAAIKRWGNKNETAAAKAQRQENRLSRGPAPEMVEALEENP